MISHGSWSRSPSPGMRVDQEGEILGFPAAVG
jgi:hypothetical protein